MITSMEAGVASHHLPYLFEAEENYELVLVVLNVSSPPKNWRWWQRKWRKMRTIGPLGALCGFFMRKWYGTQASDLLKVALLKELCSRYNREEIYQEVEGLNSLEMEQLLSRLDLDLAVSLGNGFITPRIFRIPRFGMLNVHHEELPKFRNAQSVIWQLYEGSNRTGYSIHEIEREIDAGRILKKSLIPIEFEDTLGRTVSRTYAALWEASVVGLSQVLNSYNDHVESASSQVGGGHYTTPTVLQFLRVRKNWRILRKSESKSGFRSKEADSLE